MCASPRARHLFPGDRQEFIARGPGADEEMFK